MFAHRGTTDRKARGELAHGDRPAPQLLDDPAAGRVAECVEHRFGNGFVTHEQRLL